MAENSGIEWTTHTFNPWRGCTKVSPGCAHCYAETMSGRNPKTLGVWGPSGTRVVAAEAQWRLPLKWDRAAKAAGERHRVFCASLADVFEDWQGAMVDSQGRTLEERQPGDDPLYSKARPLTMDDVRRRLFDLIDATPNLDWLLVTKRPENIARMMPAFYVLVPEPCRNRDHFGKPSAECPACRASRPPSFRPNVWLGTSVENQAAADARIPHLLATPAAVRFLSCEPMLGPVRLPMDNCNPCAPGDPSACTVSASGCGCRIDWGIVGGESGPGARPMQVEWARDLVRQCQSAGVACFVKQLGARPMRNNRFPLGPHDAEEGAFPQCQACGGGDFGPCPNGEVLCNGCDTPWGGLRDRKGGDPEEWPADLRVREFPGVQQ